MSRLQNVVSTLNDEKTRLIGMKPVDAIKETLVRQGFSQPVKNYEEKLIDVGTKVRYLYEAGKLEGHLNTKAKEGKDLLTLYGRQMCIKSKIDTLKNISQHCTI